MEALKAIKLIGNQNDGRAVFLFLPNTGYKQRVLNFMRDPKPAHTLVAIDSQFAYFLSASITALRFSLVGSLSKAVSNLYFPLLLLSKLEISHGGRLRAGSELMFIYRGGGAAMLDTESIFGRSSFHISSTGRSGWENVQLTFRDFSGRSSSVTLFQRSFELLMN